MIYFHFCENNKRQYFCSLSAEPHQYQLRAYIYQARDLVGSDQDGYSGISDDYKTASNMHIVSVVPRFLSCAFNIIILIEIIDYE